MELSVLRSGFIKESLAKKYRPIRGVADVDLRPSEATIAVGVARLKAKKGKIPLRLHL
jgi:hypothetical protein